MQTLGVYIQVPFCASKCSFCNFSSRVAPASVFDAYCDAIVGEIERLPEFYAAAGIGSEFLDLPVDTLYLGGGTPTLLGAKRLERIMDSLWRRFHCAPPLEFTLEMTPGSADDEFLARCLALGVNRLSIGAQSFQDRELAVVGRLHDAAATVELVARARREGFRNISLDLIAGLPHQTRDSWTQTLGAALALRPEHVSVYLFEIDEKSRLGGEVLRHGTRYHAGEVPGEDFMAEAYELAREVLKGEGYEQYEISNFALPGFESRHNRKYWRLEPYVGLGAGAHSFSGEHRWANEASPDVYGAKLARGEQAISEFRKLSPEEQIEEFFFLGLRERGGVDLEAARLRWGRDQVGWFETKAEELTREGLIKSWGGHIRLAVPAYLVSNEIFQEFLVAEREPQ